MPGVKIQSKETRQSCVRTFLSSTLLSFSCSITALRELWLQIRRTLLSIHISHVRNRQDLVKKKKTDFVQNLIYFRVKKKRKKMNSININWNIADLRLHWALTYLQSHICSPSVKSSDIPLHTTSECHSLCSAQTSLVCSAAPMCFNIKFHYL